MTDANGWPDATPEMLACPLFNAVWQVIKTWDINVPHAYVGYCGATGNHARAILDGIQAQVAAREAAAAEAMREACAQRVDDDGIGDPRDRQLRAYLAGQLRVLALPSASDALIGDTSGYLAQATDGSEDEIAALEQTSAIEAKKEAFRQAAEAIIDQVMVGDDNKPTIASLNQSLFAYHAIMQLMEPGRSLSVSAREVAALRSAPTVKKP
jgi:hypothetical protein